MYNCIVIPTFDLVSNGHLRLADLDFTTPETMAHHAANSENNSTQPDQITMQIRTFLSEEHRRQLDTQSSPIFSFFADFEDTVRTIQNLRIVPTYLQMAELVTRFSCHRAYVVAAFLEITVPAYSPWLVKYNKVSNTLQLEGKYGRCFASWEDIFTVKSQTAGKNFKENTNIYTICTSKDEQFVACLLHYWKAQIQARMKEHRQFTSERQTFYIVSENKERIM